jgi:hypothetical protein
MRGTSGRAFAHTQLVGRLRYRSADVFLVPTDFVGQLRRLSANLVYLFSSALSTTRSLMFLLASVSVT